MVFLINGCVSVIVLMCIIFQIILGKKIIFSLVARFHFRAQKNESKSAETKLYCIFECYTMSNTIRFFSFCVVFIYFYKRCQDRIPQSVDGLGDQNSPSGLFPEFVSFFTVTAHNQKSLNHNTLYTLLTNRSIRIKES